MTEFIKARRNNGSGDALLDGPRRAMQATYQREMDGLESHLSFLASAGSVSPYLGLLGTVWGIMHAFIGLSSMQQATLASVAPGIAEALIATAIGLFAAIPAVWPTTTTLTKSTVYPFVSTASLMSSLIFCNGRYANAL